MDGAARKSLGAYYTDVAVAGFLLHRAVTRGDERVLDPSFGGGVFLDAATRRLRELGGDPARQIYGIEIEPTAHLAVPQRLSGGSWPGVLCASFFDVSPAELTPVDAVVGNPPFIRYQRFTGAMRACALARAAAAGVRLSHLSSSWAPFLVHAGQFVKPGGKLAMVAPAELTYATYARPVLDYLRRAFSTTSIISFARKLFPALSEDTVLVLAEGRGAAPGTIELVDLPDSGALDQLLTSSREAPRVTISTAEAGRVAPRLQPYVPFTTAYP